MIVPPNWIRRLRISWQAVSPWVWLPRNLNLNRRPSPLRDWFAQLKGVVMSLSNSSYQSLKPAHDRRDFLNRSIVMAGSVVAGTVVAAGSLSFAQQSKPASQPGGKEENEDVAPNED